MRRNEPWQGLLRADARRSTWYAASSLAWGLVGTLVVVFGLVYSVALAVLGVGVLLFGLVAAIADRLLRWECGRARRLLDVAVDLPRGRTPASRNPFGRAVEKARQPRTYRRLVAVLLGGPTGIVTALVALGCWYLVLRGVLELAFVVVWPEALDDAWGGSRFGALLVHVVPGVVAWFAGPPLIRAAALSRAHVLRSLVEENESSPVDESLREEGSVR